MPQYEIGQSCFSFSPFERYAQMDGGFMVQAYKFTVGLCPLPTIIQFISDKRSEPVVLGKKRKFGRVWIFFIHYIHEVFE